MKYVTSGKQIPLPQRKWYNGQCLQAIQSNNANLSREDIFDRYTGIGGLHGLEYKDYGNYHDFAEAKKEIEQGQFFTPDALCKWVVDCLRPSNSDKVADLTCGKGSFFNHMPNENNLYGCEIEHNSFAIAGYLFPQAQLTLGDVRTYTSTVKFNLVVGNPPYNISWDYKKKRVSSQTGYILKAADLLLPAGLLAVIVPTTFLGEMTPKSEKKVIFERYNYVVQLDLDANSFAYLGVRNFPTKLMILQSKAKALPDVPYSPELVHLESSDDVYRQYVQPVKENSQSAMPKIQLEINRSSGARQDLMRKFQLDLYQIKCHPRTNCYYNECERLVNQYLTQKCPPDMNYREWQENRVHSKSVLDKMKQILSEQNSVEVDKIELIKGKKHIYYRGYSEKTKDKATQLNENMDMKEITQLIPYGGEKDLHLCGVYQKLIAKKQKEYRLQTTNFADMTEDEQITKWLQNWELNGLTEDFKEIKIKLNEMQLYDTNLALQKRYAYLQWSQGAGKTVSGTAQGMYRLAQGHVEYVFVVSSAISIETTWAPFLQTFGIPHKVIRKRADLRLVYPGDFVLITLGRVKNYQRQIKHIVKLASRKLFLIYDEAQNSSALEQNDEVGRLTKATIACFSKLKYKLLMSGTSINNNVVEVYPQLYLMYNASTTMLTMADTLYTYDTESDFYNESSNGMRGKPYPPYVLGKTWFRMSHLPEKLTVFGVVKTTPDIFNAEILRDIINYTMITRTFTEVTGKDLERRSELTAVMTPAEQDLYQVALKEFVRLEYLYFKSDNMNERKKAQARIIAQIKIMLRICTCAGVFPEYTGDGLTGKLKLIFYKIREIPDKRVVIGVRQNSIVNEYAKMARKHFPDRPVFTVTGSEYNPKARKQLVNGRFMDYENSILICTQQCLSESISIDFVDYCFLPEMHWNDSKMGQFYYRFIRYTSTREKFIYYVNYPDSIETNLIYLLVSKERMLRFLKGQDISFQDLFAEMGFDFSLHQNVTIKQRNEEGRAELTWGKQNIAA